MKGVILLVQVCDAQLKLLILFFDVGEIGQRNFQRRLVILVQRYQLLF